MQTPRPTAHRSGRSWLVRNRRCLCSCCAASTPTRWSLSSSRTARPWRSPSWSSCVIRRRWCERPLPPAPPCRVAPCRSEAPMVVRALGCGHDSRAVPHLPPRPHALRSGRQRTPLSWHTACSTRWWVQPHVDLGAWGTAWLGPPPVLVRLCALSGASSGCWSRLRAQIAGAVIRAGVSHAPQVDFLFPVTDAFTAQLQSYEAAIHAGTRQPVSTPPCACAVQNPPFLMLSSWLAPQQLPERLRSTASAAPSQRTCPQAVGVPPQRPGPVAARPAAARQAALRDVHSRAARDAARPPPHRPHHRPPAGEPATGRTAY